MLSSHLLKRLFVTLTALLITGASIAGEPSVPSQYSGAKLSPQEIAKFTQLTRTLEQKAAQGAADPKMQQEMANVSRRADDIASQAITGQRDKVLRFLGINPNSSDALYIFVSWSMPLPMLRAYAVEAMWTGADLVFRGIPPGISITDFFLKDLRQIVYDKGASSIISIDPRLFDTYRVSVAPTIVLTTNRNNFTCVNAGKGYVTVKKKSYSYDLCPPLARNEYWKIAGAVTLGYALRQFEQYGSKGAPVFLKALKRGYVKGTTPSRNQEPFTGKWKTVWAPDQAMQKVASPAP